MAYKLLAIDIDDTLLNSRHEISERNKRAIAAARDKGIVVTIATGRGYMGSSRFMHALELSGPMINYGGAQVTHFPSGEVLHEIPVPRDVAEECVAIAREKGIYLQTYERDIVRYERGSKWVDMYSQSVGYPLTKVDDLLPVDYLCPKLLFVDEPENIPGLLAEIAARLGDRAQVSRSKPMFIEINDPEANKGAALEALAKQMGISRDEVAAIGDNTIDISMIQYAGLGVCMENGSPDVCALADVVAPSNDADGVAEIIEKYML